MYNIPILFIIFKRKDIALHSFERIKQVKPDKLYIACDGPRTNVTDESKAVEDTRTAILNAIDWDCQVKTLFRKENLGCCKGVYTAINWLFEHEEQGIIIEDDCVADPSFYEYAKEMLSYYRDDYRIGMIAGSNPIKKKVIKDSYCFSKYAACWGWATWRRAWKNMKLNMDFMAEYRKDILINRGYCNKDTERWKYQIKMIDKQRVSAWDWQWYFSLTSQNQLCIFPKENLIANIGNDKDATHTALSNTYVASHRMDFPLIHPEYVMPNIDFDYQMYKTNNTFMWKIKRHMPYNIKECIKKIITTIKH